MKVGRFLFCKSTRSTAVALALLAVGASYLARNATADRTTRVAILREPKAVSHTKPPGLCVGEEYLGSIEIVPDAVVTTKGRERVEYHGELTLRPGNAVAVIWDAEFINDKGEVVKGNLLKKRNEKRKGGDTATSVTVTANLADGFYALRLAAQLVPAEGPADTAEAIQYINVQNGKWRELTSVEWYESSNAGIAALSSDDSGAAQ